MANPQILLVKTPHAMLLNPKQIPSHPVTASRYLPRASGPRSSGRAYSEHFVTGR